MISKNKKTTLKPASVLIIIISSILLNFITPLYAKAENRMDVKPDTLRLPLSSYLTIIKDSQKNMDMNEVLRMMKDHSAENFVEKKTNIGLTSAAHWGYAEIYNDSPAPRTLIYEIDGRNENIELYIENSSGTYEIKKAGTEYPFSQNGIKYRNIAYELKFQPYEQKKVIIRNTSLIVRFPITIWDQTTFIEKSTSDANFLGITYGIFLIMIVYNLFLLFSLKERIYLYYIMTVLSCLLFFMVINGTAYMYLWPNHPFWETRSYMFFDTFTLFWFFLFLKNFLETKKYLPKMNMVIVFMIILNVFGMFASVSLDFVLSRHILPFINFPSLGAGLLAGICLIKKQRRIAITYLISFFPVFFGSFLYLFKQFGLLSYNVMTEYSLQIGFTLQIAFLSIALADKINMLKNQVMMANDTALKAQQDVTIHLEKKVRERTVALEEANLKLRNLSNIDGLSSLFNRRYFDEMLQKEWQKHISENKPISLLICDIDFFKKYNDNYGHLAGDLCIQSVAKEIKECCSPSDIPARYGGEEFVILMRDTNEERAKEIGERLRQNVFHLNIPHEASLMHHIVTLSIGMSTLYPDAIGNEKTLLELADKALYYSKENGKNRVTVYNENF
ncbi:diguanylate cyclase domain-containing protein [Ectobacillus sp. sgz5001026]|uniref:sensor domain-containing diguanylate cyclase n=1 Tax=Ectobacillus sp. sgz5001026 TaxID=3242473 RepID=UPI0036D23629